MVKRKSQGGNEKLCLVASWKRICYNKTVHADMAELADAPDLGSGVFDVQVQVLLSAFQKRLV